MRPRDTLQLYPCLELLQGRVSGLHVGGKTALAWHGIRHSVGQRDKLHFYGWKAATLPSWFVERFPAEYHRKRLFEEEAEALLHVFEARKDAPLVSSPERGLLELLSEVGVRQPLSEARELTKGTHTLRLNVLVDLLKKCKSVKTVRLCLHLGRDLSMPWASELDPKELPTGSDKAWVSRSRDGTLILKP